MSTSSPDTVREPSCGRCGGRIDPSTRACLACGTQADPPSEPPAATRRPHPPSTVTTPSQRRAIYAIVGISMLLAGLAALASYCGKSTPAPTPKASKHHGP